MPARLTPHQSEVLASVKRTSQHTPGGFVNVGADRTCQRLVTKGYLEARETFGPRGGKHVAYRPVRAPFTGSDLGTSCKDYPVVPGKSSTIDGLNSCASHPVCRCGKLTRGAMLAGETCPNSCERASVAANLQWSPLLQRNIGNVTRDR